MIEKYQKKASFTDCINEMNNTKINNAKGIDIVQPMYNLREYSNNYSKTQGSLWQYYGYEPVLINASNVIDFPVNNNNNNNDNNNSVLLTFKEKITHQTNDDGTKDVDIMAPLKYLLNF